MKLKKYSVIFHSSTTKLKVGSLNSFVLGALCCNFVGLTLSLLLFTLCSPCDGRKNEKRQQSLSTF